MQKWIDSALGANNFLVQKQQLLTIVFVQVQEVLFLVDHKPTEPMHWLCSSHKTFQVISSRLLFFFFSGKLTIFHLHGLSQEFHQLGHALCVLILFAVARCGWCLSLPLNLPYHADGAAHSLRPRRGLPQQLSETEQVNDMTIPALSLTSHFGRGSRRKAFGARSSIAAGRIIKAKI